MTGRGRAGRVVSLWPRIVLETVERVGVGGDRPPGVYEMDGF